MLVHVRGAAAGVQKAAVADTYDELCRIDEGARGGEARMRALESRGRPVPAILAKHGCRTVAGAVWGPSAVAAG